MCPVYICDADALISLHRHFRDRGLKRLRQAVKAGTLGLPEGVVREIKRGTDALKDFVRKYEDKVAVLVGENPQIRDELVRIERAYGEEIRFGERQYPGFWKSRAGREAADGQVVAIAKVLEAVAVSDDQAVRLACALEDVECIGWTEFARRIGLIEQPRLI